MFNFKSFFFKEKTHSDFLVDCLKRMAHKRAPVLIHFDDDSQAYANMILEVKHRKNTLVFDEFSDHQAHLKMCAKMPFFVSASLDGVQVHFNSCCIQAVPHLAFWTYHARFPDTFNYSERRQTKRVKIRARPLNAIIKPKPMQLLNAEVSDVSPEGIRLTVLRNVTSLIQENMLLSDCAIYLDEGDVIDCDLEIKYRQYHPEDGRTHIGARFARLNPVDARMLEYFIYKRTTLQCQTIR